MDGDLSQINEAPPIAKRVEPKCRRPIRPEDSKVNGYLKRSSEELHMKDPPLQRRKSIHENGASSDENSNDDKQMTDNSDVESEEQELLNYSAPISPFRSRTVSPERIDNNRKNSWERSPSKRKKLQSSDIKQDTNSFFPRIIIMVLIVVVVLYLSLVSSSNTSVNQTEFASNRNSVFKHIEDVKNKFYHQDSRIWDEISSGINEVKTRTPKVPSIILLFANETHTMDCLALALAHLSSNVLGGDSPLNLNPKDFGDDPGEIIHILKDVSTKKAVIIRDVLNINAEAIKALHNLCDRINPLIREVIYIITMQAKNYESSQQKMAFVEKQLYRKLSKNIDEDILTALVTRITDGAIISVQPEPNLRYC